MTGTSCSSKSAAILYLWTTVDAFARYIPSGTSKFGALTIESIAGESVLQYRLFIDGQERWSTHIVSPVSLPQSENPLASLWSRIRPN